MSVEIANLVHAQLIVDLPAAATAPTVVKASGFVAGTEARSAAGVYTFELEDESIDPDSVGILIGNGATGAPAGLFVAAEITVGTPNLLTVRTFDATGAAADAGTRAFIELHNTPTTS